MDKATPFEPLENVQIRCENVPAQLIVLSCFLTCQGEEFDICSAFLAFFDKLPTYTSTRLNEKSTKFVN